MAIVTQGLDRNVQNQYRERQNQVSKPLELQVTRVRAADLEWKTGVTMAKGDVKVLQAVTRESGRCAIAFLLTSLSKILAVVDQELISKHVEEFMNLDGSDVRAMIDNDRVQDLKLLYQLVSRLTFLRPVTR
ncbi:hypothetical protein PG984_011075 [Apiospora sp. TS-2023a]